MLHTNDIIGVILAAILIFCILLLIAYLIRACIYRRRARKKLDELRAGTTFTTLAEAGLAMFGGAAGMMTTRDNMFLPNVKPDRCHQENEKTQSLEEILLNYR